MSALPDYEKMGLLYLGRGDDGTPLLLPSSELCTHAVVLGMTGSGKTGLAVALLEEAAIDGVPALVVDPKGDLANLLLTFPRLAPEDFAPWTPPGKTPEEEAARWTAGLAAWGQDGARVARLRAAAEVTVYTPGSRAATPLSILASLAAPPAAARADEETLGERVAATAASLLGLVGAPADPVRSREHVLVATILRDAWTRGHDLDLGAIVARVQDPGVEKVGVLGLEAFFPRKDRTELAVAFNALLASPSFAAWTEGPPLDVQSLLHAPDGRPRVAVLSIAHLGDAERTFFVSLLLEQLLAWMRAQPGTSALRALFFMDEIAGYFPPVASPPTKRPLLLLLKQARAFGLGVVLATQNPVDLDYKGLSNAGTWFLGRLQTERDKARVLDGLEAAGAARGDLERAIAGLAPRRFLMHSVHRDGLRAFESRWTLSYLRGPLTRDELKALARPPSVAGGSEVGAVIAPVGAGPRAGGASAPAQEERAGGGPSPAAGSRVKPSAPAGVQEVFVAGPSGAAYRPCALGVAKVALRDRKDDFQIVREVTFAAPIEEGPLPVRWEGSTFVADAGRVLEGAPATDATFAPLPAVAGDAKAWAAWSKAFAAWLAQNQGVVRLRSPSTGALSGPGEDEGAFRARLAHLAREERERTTGRLRERYAPKAAALDAKIARARAALADDEAAARAATFDSALGFAGVAAALLGGRAAGRRATSAARGAGRAAKQAGDAARRREALAALEGERRALEAELGEKLAAASSDGHGEVLEQVPVRPKKGDVAVELFALAWLPSAAQ